MTLPVSNNPQLSSAAALASYVLTAGSDRILVVTVGSENAGSATPYPATSVLFGAVAMTKATSSEATLSNTTIGTWYLLEADFPAVETQTITPSFSTTPANYHVTARTLTGAKQQAASVVQTGTGTTSPRNTSITTTDDDSLVMEGCTASRTNEMVKTQAAQVDDGQITGSSSRVAISHSPQATAGSITLGWTQVSVERLVQSLTAWSPVASTFQSARRNNPMMVTMGKMMNR